MPDDRNHRSGSTRPGMLAVLAADKYQTLLDHGFHDLQTIQLRMLMVIRPGWPTMRSGSSIRRQRGPRPMNYDISI
ncbi:hypothetical protein [Burkholderia multivorans]|uniref:hypothetical protein n=1 Tax=Burkholderia multivorans TaxID=87883 RepID=UPI001955270D|nr:hypothetical protein [Burkholderia multivorans]MDN8029254.1 hypothetical protein [Burkholderia multivorans]